jgi:SNF2 family DNA or RNA helicase
VKTHGRLAFLDHEHPEWVLSATPDVLIRVKRLFPRAATHARLEVAIRDTPEVARDLEWLLQRWPLEIADADLARLTAHADEHRSTEQAVHEILTGQRPHLDLAEVAREPRDYQLVAADLALTTGRLLLADDVGLGKSMSCLLVLRNPGALPALVVCLPHLARQWQDELAKTLPALRPHIVRTLSPYDPAKRLGRDPDVLIVPYSKLRGWGEALAGRVRTVIFDEMQDLRHPDTAKYEAAERVAEDAVFRLGATATPVYNYGGEIYSLVSILAPDVLGSPAEFSREWCGGYGHGGVDKKSRVRDPAALGVYLREQGVMLRRTRRDVGRELPEVIRVPHSIDVDEDALDLLTLDAVELAEMIVARTAARQELWKASGEFDWKMRHATGVAKAPYVAEFTRLLLDAEEQVVLFGWHRDVYDIWADRLADYEPAYYTGTESPTRKHASYEDFASGRSRVLFVSLRAGAGLDGLQHVSNIAVFGELDWSPGIHDQCIGRLHRDGMTEPVVAYFLVADQGADPVIADVLNLKRAQSGPLRDPDQPLFQPVATDDRIRQLALDVLRKRRRA